MDQLTTEQARLRALHDAGILDTAPDPRFDSITSLARDIFGVPIALISLIDETRQWFKSSQGLDGVTETAREIAFCDHTIRTPEVMVVDDALKDDRFRSNPFVTGEPHIRFYAGAPLITPEGYALGTICVIDRAPRSFSDKDKQRLADLAGIVTGLIESHALAQRAHLMNRSVAETAELSQMLLDSSDAGVLLLRAIRDEENQITDFLILAANRANLDFNGSTPAELVGKTILDRFPTLKDEHFFSEYQRAIDEKTSIRLDVFFGEDGVRAHWFDLSIRHIENDDIVVTFFPVTGKRIFQAALEQITESVPKAALNPGLFKERLLEIGARSLGMTNGFASKIDGDIYNVRELWGEDVGLKTGDVLPLSSTMCDLVCSQNRLISIHDADQMEDCTHPAVTDSAFRSYIGAPVYRDGKPYGAVSFASRTPREKPFEDWEISLVQLIAGHIGQALELRAAIEKNENMARELRHVLDNVPSQIWYKDDNNTILRANMAALRSVNLTRPEEIEGKKTEDLFPEMAAKYLADDLAVIESGVPRRGIIESFAPAGGHHAWMSTDKVPIIARNGKRYVIAVATDITALKEKEDQLARVNESLADFAFVAAHDLRAPLRQAALFTELMKSEFEDHKVALPGMSADYLAEIEAGNNRMREMVSDLYDLFRLDREKIHMTDVDLSGTAHVACAQLEEQIEGVGAKVEISQLPHVNGNRALLTQVFQNLISNACKYARAENLVVRIWSETDVAARRKRIYVEDNGVGIAHENALAVFEPFKRFSHSSSIAGAGIGLALCRKICVLHNADLFIDTDVTKGARFVISFSF